MFTPSIASLGRTFRSARGFLNEGRGTAAIEFAIIVPLMIVLYVGAAEIGNTLTVSRRADEVVYTAADLVAQEKTISGNKIADYVQAAGSILAPYSTNNLTVVLTSVVADDRNRPKVAWSCGYYGGQARSTGSNFPVPDGLTEKNSSVIVAEITYRYDPMIDYPNFFSDKEIFTVLNMTRTFYTRPRRSATVEKTGNGCGSVEQ